MKKSILAVAVILGSTAFAQKMESKNGEAYLPAAEDWAIGVNATPFLNYFGNLIGGGQNANNAPTWNYLTTNQQIMGKYFVEDDMAYRASIRLGFGSDKGSEMEVDRGFDMSTVQYPSVAPNMVENTYKMGSTNIGLSVGMEKRRGFGRLQGFYGAELGFSISSMKNTFTYGNAYDSDATFNISASTDDDFDRDGDGTDDLMTDHDDVFGNTGRMTEEKSGANLYVGLRGFIGAEYFVLPRLAIGGEFGWGLVFDAGGTSSVTYETEGLNSSGTEVQSSFTDETVKESSFGIDTDRVNSVFGPAGALRMTFHF